MTSSICRDWIWDCWRFATMQKIARPSRGSQTKEVRSSTRLLSCHTLFTSRYIWQKSRQCRNRNTGNKYGQYVGDTYESEWSFVLCLGVAIQLLSTFHSISENIHYQPAKIALFSMEVFDGLVKRPHTHGIHISTSVWNKIRSLISSD